MRRILLGALLAVLAAPAFGADDRHVIIITMDGFPAYMFHDRRSPIPTIRALAEEGCSAEGMQVANPSVTWPNHTTIVTGVSPAIHSVLFNGLLIRGGPGQPDRINPAEDQSDLVKAPTLWDIAHKAGLSTAAINWPCTRNSPTLDDCFPDVADQVDHISPKLKEELVAAHILPGPKQSQFISLSAPARDQIWTQSACWVIRHHKPNLLLLHMLLTDTVQHEYGPLTTAAFSAAAVEDYELKELLAAVDDAGIRASTTIFLTADHGFARYEHMIEPNVMLRKAGYSGGQVQAVAEGGCAFVYFNEAKPAADLQDKIVALFKDKEGIENVYTPDQFASLGLPTPDANPHMANLFLTAKDTYSFAGVAFGSPYVDTQPGTNRGSHGYLDIHPKMYAQFAVAGRGIRKGVKLGVLDNRSIAPTAAHLLGLEIPDAQGKILTEVLEPGQ